MSKVLRTYSGLDVNFSMAHPFVGVIQASGVAQKGMRSLGVRMSIDQASIQQGIDGATVPSVLPGDQGEIELSVWQTSFLHQELLAWYNACKAARDAGDVSQWFGATLLIASTVDGSSHSCTGVGPAKVPDKSYQEQAQAVTWILKACNIVSEY
jgi:hypothetical protein